MLTSIFKGNIVHSKGLDSLEILPDGIIGVDSNGTILFVTSGDLESALADYYASVDKDFEQDGELSVIETSQDQFILPGFFDTHIHAPQFPNAGIFGHSTLLDWLETYTFPLESSYTDAKRAAEVYTRLVDRTLANGTTMASYYGTIHVPATTLLAEIALEKGQRAWVGRVCMERFSPETLVDGSLESDKQFIEKIRALDKTGLSVKPVLTPRFAPSCEMETMKQLGELAHAEQLPVQTHVSENDKEIAWVKELFPDCKSYTDVYEQARLLKPDTILAHGVHLGNDEIELIKSRQCGISHCPISNASIASGMAPIKSYLDQQVKVSLGTDVSGGFSPSVLVNAREALLMSRLLAQRHDNEAHKLSVNNVLFLATLGGAQCCCLEDKLGNFEVGKQFDAQLIDVTVKGSPIDVFDWHMPKDPEERLENLIHKWVYIGDDRNTRQVWVDGKAVVDKPDPQ